MTTTASSQPCQEGTADQTALLLMLTYVEAECLRIGAGAAARHAAMAAALLPNSLSQDEAALRGRH